MKKVFNIRQLKKELEKYDNELSLGDGVCIEFGYYGPGGFYELDKDEVKPKGSVLAINVTPIVVEV